MYRLTCPIKLSGALILTGLLLPQMRLSSAVGAEPPKEEPRGAMHDAISEKDLQKKVQATPTFDAMMAARSKPVEDRPSTESTLFSSSVILSDGDTFTLVPAGSILNLPAKFRSRILTKPKGDFTFWPNFLKQNTEWLAAKEVPLGMAKGDAKLAQGVLRDTATDGRVLVAVYKGGPIMILEPAPPDPKAPAATASREDASAARDGGR